MPPVGQRNGGGRTVRAATTACILAMLQVWNLAPGVLGFGSVARRSCQRSSSATIPLRMRMMSTKLALVPAELVSDVVTSGTINTISDCVAQLLENSANNTTAQGNRILETETMGSKEENSVPSFASLTPFRYDAPRTQRLAMFGLADGVVSHAWFLGLDGIVGEGQGLADTLVKTAADSLVYTPLWCAWFLASMTLLEGEDDGSRTSTIFAKKNDLATKIGSIPSVWRSDWWQLLKGNLGFFLPITGAIYGVVPREERVLAFGVAGLIYTTILSLWNQNRSGGSGTSSLS